MSAAGLDAELLLAAVPHPVAVVGADGRFLAANPSAEGFFRVSGPVLRQRTLARMVTGASDLIDLVDRARTRAATVFDGALQVDGPGLPVTVVDASATPLSAPDGAVLIVLRERAVPERVGQPDSRRLALRPVTGMAALLAHEIKNPLSGIRGAAQLLAAKVAPEDAELTVVIREEVDRIAELVDRMDVFREQTEPTREPLNIHEVLDHVCRLAATGFGAQVEIVQQYDPSLPPLSGDRGQLIQVFLNLLKNACEAAGAGGRVALSTAYRHDLQRVGPGGRSMAHLPLEVAVEDDGPGVPDDLMASLFEPFVTTRRDGSGLGLAVVAKIVADHNALIDCRSRPGRTVFRTRWARVPQSQKEVRA